jgi:hypothetical protein
MMRTVGIAAAIFSIGCIEGAIPAPSSATLEVPTDVTVAWDIEYNGAHDNVGTVLMTDMFVYDSEENMPLEHIEVEVVINGGGVYAIPAEAVQLVGYPEASVDPSEAGAIKDACTDDEGNFKSDPEWCAWYWDTDSGQYYQIGGQYIATSSNYAPNYFVGQTDNRGILNMYLYVDWFKANGEEVSGGDEEESDIKYSFSATTISASIGVDGGQFTVRPAVAGE